MDEIDLKEFETRVEVTPLRLEDFAAVRDLQLRCFPNMAPWKQEQFESQLRVFPEGQVGIRIDGRLVATSASVILDYSDYSEWHDWKTLADNGYIRNHDPDGDTLYGIEIQVDPEFRGMKLARRLYDVRKAICRDHNLQRIMVGGRIPGYAKYKHEMNPHEYVERVMARKLYDPVLTTQIANGFVLRQIVPDYLPNDEDSAGYATCLEWSNLDYVHQRSRRHRRAVEHVRTALVQYQMRAITSFEDFSQQCAFFVDTSSDSKADFVLFPELFTLQLLSLLKETRPGQAARELAGYTPQFLDLFGDLAVRYNINIIAGTQFTEEDDFRLYNVSYLFHRDGRIDKQYKLHITPNEQRWWGISGGDEMQVFDTDCGKIAIFVCYDIQFPELARVAVDKGARIFFVPYNTNDRYGHLRVRLCAQARCIENHVFVVTAGCVGNLPLVENADIHYAQSGIFTPSDIPFARDGIASECSPNLETVLMQDLDLELLRRARRGGTVQNWNDRRKDLYSVVWKEADDRREV
jgi:predicted amidohydrolase/ribosomal protein S18 acetylase RimI-like enzyme